MRVSVDSFFLNLNVNTQYFIEQFKVIGVQNRFFFDRGDLELIVTKLPKLRYKSALVVERAKFFLEDSNNVKTY